MLGAPEVIALTLLSAVMAAAAQYIFKKGLRRFSFDLRGIFSTLSHKKTIAGLLVYGLSFVVYIYALGNVPLISFVYPVFSSSFVFILLISKYALGEKVGMHRTLGILLILAGILVISITFPV